MCPIPCWLRTIVRRTTLAGTQRTRKFLGVDMRPMGANRESSPARPAHAARHGLARCVLLTLACPGAIDGYRDLSSRRTPNRAGPRARLAAGREHDARSLRACCRALA